MIFKISKKPEQAPPKAKADVKGSAKVAAARSIKSLWKKLGRPGSLKTFVQTHDEGRATTTGKQWLANKKLRGRG
jgi:hypothetical protein